MEKNAKIKTNAKTQVLHFFVLAGYSWRIKIFLPNLNAHFLN
jgi:hypothetical protein